MIGKAISAGFRGLAQTIIIELIALAMWIQINWSPLAVAELLFSVALGAATFSTFSLIMACIVKSRERFMGIGQVLTMPLFFASNAIYPFVMMPKRLRVVVVLNLLTYLVDALRGIMILGGQSVHSLPVDLVVLPRDSTARVEIASVICVTLQRDVFCIAESEVPVTWLAYGNSERSLQCLGNNSQKLHGACSAAPGTQGR